MRVYRLATRPLSTLLSFNTPTRSFAPTRSVRMLTAAQLAFLPFSKLLPGRLVARRDRFIAEVILDAAPDLAGLGTSPAGGAAASSVVAHCVNPGRMEAFVEVGARVFLSHAPADKQRKCAYTWELLEHTPPGTTEVVLCGTNTQRPNDLALALLRARSLEGLREWTELRQEVPLPLAASPVVLHAAAEAEALEAGGEREASAGIGAVAAVGKGRRKGATSTAVAPALAKGKGSAKAEPRGRCDFLLLEPADEAPAPAGAAAAVSAAPAAAGADSAAAPRRLRAHWLEVKNCHMVYADGYGYFPDSVSERASRHVHHLAERARAGDRATVLFVVQRGDVLHGVRPSDHHDPLFAAACREAAAAGVRFRAVRVRIALDGAAIEAELPVDMRPYALEPIAAQCAANAASTGWDRGFDGSHRRVANGPFPHNLARGARRGTAPAAERSTAAELDGADAAQTFTPEQPQPKAGTARARRRSATGSAAGPAAPTAVIAAAVKPREADSQPYPARALRLVAAGPSREEGAVQSPATFGVAVAVRSQPEQREPHLGAQQPPLSGTKRSRQRRSLGSD